MMGALVDQVKTAVDESKTEARYEGYIKEVTSHRTKVDDLQKQLHVKLAELEKEEKRHITSDDLREGFNVSHVKKSTDPPTKPSTSATPQLLNPARPSLNPRTSSGQSSGADADIEDGPDPDATAEVEDEESISASPLAQKFAAIDSNDYRAMLAFISQHPTVLAEKETDGLLVEAFNAQLEGQDKHARICVHQALLLQYCRQLGQGNQGGVQLFFKRITTQGHQAQKMFRDDVASTYARIRERAGVIKKQREEEGAQEGVEQIQLHAVDPNTTINIVVPPKDSQDEGEKAGRAIFESFPPGLQRALWSGSLDEVNKILGKMSVEEAEEVVEKLGDGGMLSLEEGVIDATTEEGKKQMEEIERTGKFPGGGRVEELPEGMEGLVDEKDLAGDPE
ncbi:hypothetical protein LTS18_011366 [Coniosporium uncinatum]|uniref:Uncharacterized protein n=1 Tax=Coniosporium uncinatum TaxID=93489 RepID=A0ACC3CYW5_9PEZI|nr:hypothetical protein LTS18_011366 [Coniosporium uncinatum]